ncbi:ANK1 [Symbiodinium sp. CCMP2592]|nr:ANK1 [Symbiodinium sp. CCMP2592]
MLRVWKISGDEVATLSAQDALSLTSCSSKPQKTRKSTVFDCNVSIVKRYLARAHGLPGFCQRLLQNGRQLHDHEVVKGPSELQLVMVPYGVVSAEEEVQMASSLRSRNLQQAEAILGKPYDLQSSRLKNKLLCDAAESGCADSVDLLLFAAPRQCLDTPLHSAAGRGHVDIVRLLLQARADKDTVMSGKTPLSRSIQGWRMEVVSLLLEAGANLEYGSPLPLGLACTMGQTRTVRMLLRAGADRDNKAGERPFVCTAAAAGQFHIEILKLLLKARCNANATAGDDTPLYLASFRGHSVAVRLLLDARAIVDTPVHGKTPLAVASGKGHSKIVNLLLSAKADKDRSSPLRAAIRSERKEIAQLLLRARANKDDAATGETPLGLAAGEGMTAMVRMLLQARVDTNSCVEGADPPLCQAVAAGHLDIVRLLLEARADSNKGSPLCTACDDRQTEMTQLLLTAGANADEVVTGAIPLGMAAAEGLAGRVWMLLQTRVDANRCLEGAEPPLCQAVAGGHLDIVRLLLEAKADSNKGSPLCAACDDGHTEIAQLLLTAGADVDASNTDGRTPLWLASRFDCENVVRLLLSAGANPNCVVLSSSYSRHVALGGVDYSSPTWQLLVEAWMQAQSPAD